MSFYEQFVVVLERTDESTCDGKCTYDADTSGTQTDYESCRASLPWGSAYHHRPSPSFFVRPTRRVMPCAC